jgi:hypothetical protein
MNGLNLAKGETVLWQGRPAPRCFTFRYWKQAIAGSALFLASSFWLMLALQLIKDGQPVWLGFLPLPLIVGSFVFGPLQILIARWRWPKIFYQLTDQQLSASCGWKASLSEISELKIKKHGEYLASLRIVAAKTDVLLVSCIEQPQILVDLLYEHCPQLKV